MSEMVYLEDVCEILDNRRIPVTAKDRKLGKYPYYGANGIQDYVDSYIFDDELVLLAEDGGNFGSKDRPIAYRVSGKCWVNNHAHVLKAKPMIDADYLCYSIMFYDVSSIVNGATRQKLNQADMRKMKIPLPSLDKQKYVVAVLNRITDLIAKSKRQLELLDELVKARFVEMFGNKNNYTSSTLNDVCSIITDGTHQPPTFTTSGIPFIFVSNIAKNEITYNTDKYISEETYNQLLKRTPIEIGDVLLSTVGSYGHPAVVKSNTRFLFQRHIAYFKPDHNIIDSIYLYGFFLSSFGQKQIEESVKGIAQKTLNLTEIKKIQLAVPPLKLQQEFATFVGQTDKSKSQIAKSLEQLETLKKALMRKYFG